MPAELEGSAARGFDPALFQERAGGSAARWLSADLRFHPRIDSTNTYLRTLREEEFHHGMVALADEQTGGRGQGSRVWVSEPCANLLFSIGLRPKSPERLILLTLTIAERLAGYLSDLLGDPVTIKWPNDVLVKGCKIAGILSETQFRGAQMQRMVIGVGLNVNQIDFGDLRHVQTEGDQNRPLPPASLRGCSGVEWAREPLLAHLCVLLEQAYGEWESREPELCSKINGRLLGYGEWVAVEVDERPVGMRKCLGLTPQGELLMLDERMDVERYTHEHIRLHASG